MAGARPKVTKVRNGLSDENIEDAQSGSRQMTKSLNHTKGSQGLNDTDNPRE